MEKKSLFKSIRTFIGAKDYQKSRSFYKNLGFIEIIISDDMCYFKIDESLGFYLQKANVRKWINNSMIFLEVEDLTSYLITIKSKNLQEKYPKVRISEIIENDWGSEFFLHDPSGILWHIGTFKT